MPSDGVQIQPGDIVDQRYRIIEVLGQGGMGLVFKAEHVGIRRPVALKLLHSDLRDQEVVNERIMREAFATGRLDHPNCVSITDSGRLPDGTTYLVMELLKGQSLGDELDERGTLPEAEALEICKQVLQGLAHAHGVGVVHRDLKPENIFLVKQDDADVLVKILDFGIAKLLGDAREQGGKNDLTEAGMAIGSPTYMSPEQATGVEIDGRTDIYSVSLVLFEMLVGKPPFYEPDDKLLSLQRRLKEDPPIMQTPSGAPISAAVELLVRDGLARKPEDRIPNAQTFAARIEALLSQFRPQSSQVIPRFDETPAIAVNPDYSGPAPIAMAPSSSRLLPQATALTSKQRRNLAIAGASVLAAIIILVAIVSGDDSNPKTPQEESLVMEPDLLDDSATEDPAVLAAALALELERLGDEIEKERGSENLSALQRLETLWPQNAQVNYLLGLAYMQKRYWQDGFKYLRQSIELDDALREDPELIKSALRALSSRSKPGLGLAFLVQDVGKPAIPYLKETARAGSKRQRDYAWRALRQLGAD